MNDRQWMLENPFMWVLGPLVAGVITFALVQQYKDEGLDWPIALAALAVIILFSGYLRTRLSSEELTITWFPIWRRRIPLRDIQEATPVAYRFRDFGGWGIRWNRRAVAYSVWSKDAIRLKIAGKRFDVVFTTRRQEEWLEALRSNGVSIQPKS